MPPPASSVSMLGRLFSVGAGASARDEEAHKAQASKPAPSLDSVKEDIHTRSLLFPDPQSLYLHRNDQVFPLSTTPTLPLASMSNAFDYVGELELEARDVRVLVMQDALGPFNASALFDTHPCPVPPATQSSPVHDTRRPPPSPRKPSLSHTARPVVIQPDNPHLRHGAFDRRPEIPPRHSSAETDPQRIAREHREEMATFTSCVFGSSEMMAYKGTSTKVHVVPTETRAPEYSASVVADGRGSVGRASMRSSKLAQSYTSDLASPTFAPPSYPFGPSQLSYRPLDRKKVLISRLFPVPLPSDDVAATQNTQKQPSDECVVRSAQKPDSMAPPKKPNIQVKQKRTPMYAVVLVIQLPASPAPAVRTPFRGSGSFTDHDSFPSSFNSARRSGWGAMGSGLESVDSSPFDGDDPMDYITQHWDIVMRTLSHLQSLAAANLTSLLKQADQATPSSYPPNSSQNINRAPSLSRRADDHKAMKPPKTNAKIVALPPNALSQDSIIQQRTHEARARIVTGLKAARVVTGQGRWGIWRDEARLAARNVGPHDHRFLLSLLTGFLAAHTDWLQALSPAWCRKLYFQRQKLMGEEDLALSTRTIIVSEDKMLARRFIFLLSAFLPAHQSIPAAHAHRPSTSTSVGALSQSPPSIIVPIVREESLRRKMTRRTGPRRTSTSHSRTVSQSTRTSVPTQLAHLSMEGHHHERRSSDAASVRTMNLSIPYGEFANRKSMAATTATTPDTTTPHFSNIHRTDSRRSARPGSSGSTAADDLRRSLQRAESTGQASAISTDSRGQSSKWGSVISGLWSGHRRRESTASTAGEAFRPPPSPSEPPSPAKRPAGKPNKLDDMVRELSMPTPGSREREPGDDGPVTPRGLHQDQGEEAAGPSTEQVKRWPEPGAPFEEQIKTTINHEDGVVEVDVPFTDYLTNPHSFDTAVSSPSSSGYLSTPGFATVMESFEQACRLALEGDLPMNSAGWLQSFHPDFVLQAIPPQKDLVKEVKASMSAEPSPNLLPTTPTDQPPSPEWVDISTAIIADVTTGKVRRIRLRRLIKPGSMERRSSHGAAGAHGTREPMPSVLPSEKTLDEEFIEDEITMAESTVGEAVERVITQVGDSKAASSNSSKSNSKPHAAAAQVPSPMGDTEDVPLTPTGVPEVPRNECRAVILTALSDIITDVIEKRATREESAIRVAVRSWLDQLEGVKDVEQG